VKKKARCGSRFEVRGSRLERKAKGERQKAKVKKEHKEDDKRP
jgi:hypothetical protein